MHWGTTTFEENLQQLTDMKEAVLHSIFLNLSKAYYDLGRDRCLDILAGFGLGPRTTSILRT